MACGYRCRLLLSAMACGEGLGFGDLECGVAGAARGGRGSGGGENDLEDGREVEGACYNFPIPKFSFSLFFLANILEILSMGRCMFSDFCNIQ